MEVATRRPAAEGDGSAPSDIRSCFQHVDRCGLADSLECKAKPEPDSEPDASDLLPSAGSTECRAACADRTPRRISQRRQRARLNEARHWRYSLREREWDGGEHGDLC